MRIGLLIYGDMETISGGYLYNRKLVDYLKRHGDQVEVISLPLRHYWHHLFADNASNIAQRIRAANIDILIQDELAHPSLLRANRQLARRTNLPLVTLIHLLTTFDQHPWYSAWIYRFIERTYLQSVSAIIANSQTTLAQTRELLGDSLPPNCIAVPAGNNFSNTPVAMEAVKHRAFAPGPLTILVVGNVIRRKGLHVLIRALGALPAGRFTVTVVGRLDMEPDYVLNIQALIKAAQLETSITLTGPLSGEPLEQLYRQHHLFVLPSAFESYGIVYVEALQFGLPVIGTTAGAAREIINHGKNGYLVEPEGHNELALLLQQLQGNRELLVELSRQALADFTRHPTWDETSEVIRQFLRERVNGSLRLTASGQTASG